MTIFHRETFLITCFYFYFIGRKIGRHEDNNDRVLGAGDGRRREGPHPFHQTGPVGRHGTGWHVDDAQACAGLAKDIVQAETSGHGRKTLGTLEEVYRRGGKHFLFYFFIFCFGGHRPHVFG